MVLVNVWSQQQEKHLDRWALIYLCVHVKRRQKTRANQEKNLPTREFTLARARPAQVLTLVHLLSHDVAVDMGGGPTWGGQMLTVSYALATGFHHSQGPHLSSSLTVDNIIGLEGTKIQWRVAFLLSYYWNNSPQGIEISPRSVMLGKEKTGSIARQKRNLSPGKLFHTVWQLFRPLCEADWSWDHDGGWDYTLTRADISAYLLPSI